MRLLATAVFTHAIASLISGFRVLSPKYHKRGQILRMRHRGERTETIAGALAIPRNEVELLLKVHDLSLEQVEKGA